MKLHARIKQNVLRLKGKMLAAFLLAAIIPFVVLSFTSVRLGEDALKNIGAGNHGLKILLDILISQNILESDGYFFEFTEGFNFALRYRELIEAKVHYLKMVYYDILEKFSKMVFTSFLLFCRILRQG